MINLSGILNFQLFLSVFSRSGTLLWVFNQYVRMPYITRAWWALIYCHIPDSLLWNWLLPSSWHCVLIKTFHLYFLQFKPTHNLAGRQYDAFEYIDDILGQATLARQQSLEKVPSSSSYCVWACRLGAFRSFTIANIFLPLYTLWQQLQQRLFVCCMSFWSLYVTLSSLCRVVTVCNNCVAWVVYIVHVMFELLTASNYGGSVSRTNNNNFSEKLDIFPENATICQGKFG